MKFKFLLAGFILSISTSAFAYMDIIDIGKSVPHLKVAAHSQAQCEHEFNKLIEKLSDKTILKKQKCEFVDDKHGSYAASIMFY